MDSIQNETVNNNQLDNINNKTGDIYIKNFLPSGIARLDSLLQFTAEIDKMTGILRRTLLVDGSRRENDAEHSWHIAVMAQLFSGYAVDKPDTGRACKMAVVHDLIEIYAGDTFAFDKEANLEKAAREKKSADKLFALLPDDLGSEIRSLWEEFDAMETADSRFANCMDRIQPFLHNTLTGGHTWLKGSASVADVHMRMDVVRKNMPAVWPWIEENIKRGLKLGWIRP